MKCKEGEVEKGHSGGGWAALRTRMDYQMKRYKADCLKATDWSTT